MFYCRPCEKEIYSYPDNVNRLNAELAEPLGDWPKPVNGTKLECPLCGGELIRK